MKKKIVLLLVLMAAFFAVGCAQSSIKINRFIPIAEPPLSSITLKDNESYINYADRNYSISAALFEYNSIIVLPLEIANKTSLDLLPDHYSISLHDGRDLKLIPMLTRDNLITARAKMDGGGSASGSIEQQLLQNTLNTIMNATGVSSKKMILSGMDEAINNYFQFRPIYAGEKREGIICFMANFKFEYPLSLIFKAGEEKIKLSFKPQTI